MSQHINPVRRDVDGMAIIGRTLHDLMGIRHDEGEGGAAPAAAPAATPAAPAAPAAAAAPAATAEPAASTAEKVEDLPAWAQKIISDTRKEAGDHRAAAKTAAEKAQQDLTDKLAVALGLKKDDATDPEKLAASLTEAQTAAKTAARELAVFKAANGIADPTRLLDRTSFTTSIQGLDPADGAAIKAAIEAAVAADPTLKAARAAGASTVDNSGGTGETGQITEEQLARMSPQEINDALEKGQLKNLL